MKKTKSFAALLALGLVFGIGLFGAAQTASAQQTDKQKTEKKKKGDDEKNEKEEDAKERKNQDKLMREATVTREQARATALRQVPGEVLEEEIEKENGKLVWAFDIKDSNGKIFDVKVDAKTGAVVSADEDKEDDGDDSGNHTRKDKNVFEKMGSGIKSATARVYRKMTGN
jgi:uncharacterized membrane protein YkoI